MVAVKGWRDPVVNEWVVLSGIASGIPVGTVMNTHFDVGHPAFGVLQDQIIATYSSAPGDSGGPIHRMDGGRWIIVGAHVGRLGTPPMDSAVFSPVSGIRTELGVVPLT